jgi:DNA-binding transcriptional MerR regulator
LLVAERLRIDDLARRTGLTTRNIRAYHTRGLLPPPEIRGRTGYYGPEHVARLQAIRDLQAAGLNLEAVKRLLQLLPEEGSEDALAFGRALLAPWTSEEPETVDVSELARRFGGWNPDALRRAEELGVLAALGDGRYLVRSPALLRAGEQVVRLGIPLEEALAVLGEVSGQADGVARAFVRLFLTNVWEPFDAAGRPAAQWARVREAIERLRPLASAVLTAAFRQRMDEEVREALGEEVERQAAGRERSA